MFIFINVNPSLNKSLLWKYFLHILLTIFTILTLARKTDIVSNKHNLLFTLNRQNQISSSIVRLFKEILRGCRLCKNYIMNSFCDKERTSFYYDFSMALLCCEDDVVHGWFNIILLCSSPFSSMASSHGFAHSIHKQLPHKWNMLRDNLLNCL